LPSLAAGDRQGGLRTVSVEGASVLRPWSYVGTASMAASLRMAAARAVPTSAGDDSAE
jgi:hypothetical protein